MLKNTKRYKYFNIFTAAKYQGFNIKNYKLSLNKNIKCRIDRN